MTPETLDLFRAVVDADAATVRRTLAAGADVNATDGKGRSVIAHAALGVSIEAIDAPIQPVLSESRLEVLQLILENPNLSLYSLNAPLPWAGGVTLLGLMSWLNMPTEITFLLEYTQGLVEVNAMDDQGATPLMYASRDGNLEVVQCLLAHGARPDLRDSSQRSAIQYALPYPQILWLCEDFLRRNRAREKQASVHADIPSEGEAQPSSSYSSPKPRDLFLATTVDVKLQPPSPNQFDSAEMRRVFDALLDATRTADIATLQNLLIPPNLENLRSPFLVNLRDSSGLSLVHHAVSQRHNSVGRVLDVLYHAGADVGLFSALGFSPLHHLARTVRDPPHFPNSEREPLQSHDLYKLTLHLLRDLRAPLGASDAKGETPLHAAAEHGNSRLVLKAMLDYDSIFSSVQPVKEMRNARRLKPVEVCQSGFLSFFAQKPAQGSAQLRSQDSWDSIPSHPPHVNARPGSVALSAVGRLLDFGRPGSRGRNLLGKASDGSLHSRSSGSSTSSSAQLHLASISRLSTRSRNISSPLHPHGLSTPSPTGTSLSDLSDTNASFNVSEYTRDLLSNLSIISASFESYEQSQIEQGDHEYFTGDLPDLSALSEALLFVRKIGSVILEHWTSRLEHARASFERARRELEKTQILREKVDAELRDKPIGDVADRDTISVQRQQSRVVNVLSPGLKDTPVQTEIPSVHVAQLEKLAILEQEAELRLNQLSTHIQMEESQLKMPATTEQVATVLDIMRERRTEEMKLREVEDEIRLLRWYAESWSEGVDIGIPLLLGWVPSGKLPQLEVVKAIDDADRCLVGREVRNSVATKSDVAIEETEQTRSTTFRLENTSRNASRVTERVAMDIGGVVAQLAQITEIFVHAQDLVNEATALFEQILKEREEELHALTYTHLQPDSPHHPPSSFRLSRNPQRTPHQMTNIQISPIPSAATTRLSPSPPSSTFHHQYAPSVPAKMPEVLHRLLSRKIEKNVQHLFNELQKAHIWLRIIREVLRGLRRRATTVNH